MVVVHNSPFQQPKVFANWLLLGIRVWAPYHQQMLLKEMIATNQGSISIQDDQPVFNIRTWRPLTTSRSIDHIKTNQTILILIYTIRTFPVILQLSPIMNFLTNI